MGQLADLELTIEKMSASEMAARRDPGALAARVIWRLLRPLAVWQCNVLRRQHGLAPLEVEQRRKGGIFSPEMFVFYSRVVTILAIWLVAAEPLNALPFPFDMLIARLIMLVAIVPYISRELWQSLRAQCSSRGARLLHWAAMGVAVSLPLVLLEQTISTVSQTAPRMLHAAPSGAGRIVWALMIICVTPALEELIWRGIGRDIFRRNIGKKWWVWNGIAFAAWHLSHAGFVSLAIMGCMAAYIAEQDASVMSSIAFHIGYNLLAVLAIWLSL